jgi:hypothetical protein
MLMGAGVTPTAACRHEETELSPESTLGHAVYRCVTCRALLEEPTESGG